MAKPPLRITCKECGNRRVKAIVTHPITGKKRRTPIKLCQRCHGKTIDYHFFKSPFGQWLRTAFLRQCTNSIPRDTNELRGLIHLWRFYRKACGFCSDGEKIAKTYNYQLCHIDPVKGEDDLVGRLNFSNLIIAPAVLNRELSNLPYPFTSKQSVVRGEAITDGNFTSICRELYDLPLLAAEFCLIPAKLGKGLPTFKSDGVDMPQILSMELKRLGYPVSHKIPSTIEDDGPADGTNKIAREVFETFFKVGGTLATNFLISHGTACPSKLLEYDFTLPYESVEKRKANKAARLDVGF